MSKFPDADIAEIRRVADIAVVLGDHTTLVRSGSSHKALCCFHEESTPSLNVTTDSDGGRFHCFGCGESGDVIDLVMKMESLSFPEAVGNLADRFGVTLHVADSDSDAEAHSARNRVIAANEEAARFFGHALLTSDEAQTARDLLTSRGFEVEQSVTDFGCGYAPRQSTALPRHLRSKGFTEQEIVAAELATPVSRGQRETLLSRFTGRITWTIRNKFGKAIGFGARRLYDDDRMADRKFINTSETVVYRKSEVLFGLDRARREIARIKQAVVVEGYTDVMACHLAGVGTAVATCGTAFTTQHLDVLRRLVGPGGEIVFAMDDDPAGREASLKVYDMAQGSLHRLSALPSSENLDPDEVRQHRGDEALRNLVEQRRPLIEAVLLNTLAKYEAKYGMRTPENRRAALDLVLPLLAHPRDPLLRAEYIGLVAGKLGYDAHTLATQVGAPKAEPQVGAGQAVVSSASSSPGWLEWDALHLLVCHRDLAVNYLEQVRSLLTRPAGQQIATALQEALLTDNPSARPWPLHVLDQAEEGAQAPLGKMVGGPPPVPEESAQAHLNEVLSRLRERQTADEEKRLSQALSVSVDEAERERLFEELLRVWGQR